MKNAMEMKTVIALTGKSGSGKTSSLKELMLKCLENPEFQPIYATKYYSGDAGVMRKNLIEHWKTEAGNISDISVSFRYKGFIICITSYGDSLKEEILPALERAIKEFGGCDVFVCGRHTCNQIKDEFQGYTIRRIVERDKQRAADDAKFDEENKRTADELYKELLYSIEG